MMIAFITIESGLVLIEGLCAQIYYFTFEIIGGFAFTSFAFLFRKKKYAKEKSNDSKISTQWNAIGPHRHPVGCPQARNVNHCT